MRGFAYVLVIGVATILVLSASVSAQTTYVIVDDFNSGSLNTVLWAYGTGSLPSVAPDDAEHGGTLNFVSSGDDQQIRASLYALPTFGPDDVLALSIDVRRNQPSCWFGVYTAYDAPPAGMLYGRTSSVSGMWGLPMPDYRPGLPGDPLYPTAAGDPQGFRIMVPSEATASPQNGSNDNYLAPYLLQTGQWYTLQLRYTPENFDFLIDRQELLSLDSSQLYYTFSQPDDWLFMLGDGGTHSWQPTNLSVDNVLLIHTKQVVLNISDAFPNQASISDPTAIAVLDGYYNLFGPETLQAALDASQGDWQDFLDYLFPPSPAPALAPEPTPAPRLVLVSLSQERSTVRMVVKNAGDAPCEGGGRIVVGLSYSTSWVPEWETWFLNQDFGAMAMAPGATVTLTFDLPAVPQETLAAFHLRRESLWTGHVDTDPADYIGIHFSVLPGNHVFGYLPLP